MGTEGIEELMEQHAERCTLDHEGSSGRMEQDLAVELYERSLSRRALKYRYFVGDGDSKAFRAVVSAKPYGESERIIKKECVGRVQKRMGTRLRELRRSRRSLRGRDNLSLKEIEKLTSYYGNAIRRNSDDAVKMKEAIWVTFYHRISTDQLPLHHLCPPGPSSWCKWQRAVSKKEVTEYKHPQCWSEELQDALKLIYQQLSNDELLERCVGGFTQNNNESYHSIVWQLAPKSRFCG